MIDKRLLEIISNETKDEICDLGVITPEIFSSVFIKNAKKHNVEDYEGFLQAYMDEKLSNFLHIQDETTKKADKLSETTSKAIEAIKEKDDGSLGEVLSETQNLRKEIEKLKESLYKDELTTVYNRKWLYDTLLDASERRFLNDGIIAVVDLNYFKIVNDTYGHIIGDKVLMFIASQLKKSHGKVIRYGGDEFLIIFDPTERLSSVEKKLHNIREEILKKHLKAKDAEFRVSFSYGIAMFKKGEKLESVIERADEAMYSDKEKIKKRITGIDV